MHCIANPKNHSALISTQISDKPPENCYTLTGHSVKFPTKLSMRTSQDLAVRSEIKRSTCRRSPFGWRGCSRNRIGANPLARVDVPTGGKKTKERRALRFH